MLNGELADLNVIAQVQFVEDTRAVGLDGLHAELQVRRHPLELPPLCQETKDLKLPVRKALQQAESRLAGQELKIHHILSFFGQEALPPGHSANCMV